MVYGIGRRGEFVATLVGGEGQSATEVSEIASDTADRELSFNKFCGLGLDMKILIADDKPQIRRVMRTLLEEHEGWSVCSEAEDGVQAVALAQQFKPDVIVLDLAMPGMNGFEAARQLSNILPGVPLIMHTLYADELVEAEAKKCGIRQVTSKPNGATLVKAIETAIADHPRAAHEAPTILGRLPTKAA